MKSFISARVFIDLSEHESLHSIDTQVYCVNLYRLLSIKPQSLHSHSSVMSLATVSWVEAWLFLVLLPLSCVFLITQFLLMLLGRRIQEVWSLWQRLWPLFPVVSSRSQARGKRKWEAIGQIVWAIHLCPDQGHFHTDWSELYLLLGLLCTKKRRVSWLLWCSSALQNENVYCMQPSAKVPQWISWKYQMICIACVL